MGEAPDYNPRRTGQRWYPAIAGASGWPTFIVPRNASMVWITAVGGAASGGGGASSGAGAIGGGGGGGGSGAVARLLIPARALPRVLYVGAGLGGVSPAGNAAGNAGARTFISAQPGSTAAADLVLVSGTLAATGGGVGTTAAGGAGAAETIATRALTAFSMLGLWVAIAGQAGVAGAINTNGGNSVTFGGSGTSLPALTGGAGGGGTNATTGAGVGGRIVGAGLVQSITAAAISGNPGSPGHNVNALVGCYGLASDWGWQQFAFTGGNGGSGKASGVGGNGGQGAWGCGGGGGGGGGGTSGGTGGRGGAGGNGFVHVMWW